MERKKYVEVNEVEIVREPKILEYQEFVNIMAAYVYRIYFDSNNGKDLTLRAEDYEWKLSTKEEFDKVCSDVVKRLYRITID